MALASMPASAGDTPIQRARQFQRAARTTTLEVADELMQRLGAFQAELAEAAGLEGMPVGLRGEFAMLSTTIRMRLQAAENLRSKL